MHADVQELIGRVEQCGRGAVQVQRYCAIPEVLVGIRLTTFVQHMPVQIEFPAAPVVKFMGMGDLPIRPRKGLG
jgi:hypothetical protein